MNLKLLLPLISFTLFVLACDEGDPDSQATTCLSSNLQNGLIASYTFGNGSLNDGIAGNDLSNVGGAIPTTDRDGNASCAYAFTGPEFLTHANPVFLNNLPSFSVSLWYHPIDSTRDGAALELLVNRGDTIFCPTRCGEWSINLYDCRQAVFSHNNEVWASFAAQGTCQDIVASQTGKWIHVVAVKDNDSYLIYHNGVLKETANGVLTGGIGTPYLAQDQGDLSLGKFFNGKMDDVLFYNRALTAAEVQALFVADACCD